MLASQRMVRVSGMRQLDSLQDFLGKFVIDDAAHDGDRNIA